MALSGDEERAERVLSSISGGVGRETLTSIMLYALNFRRFVVDKYTLRVFSRLGLGDFSRNTRALEDMVLGGEREWTVDELKNYHACIVELAKEHCRKEPVCTGCPLSDACSYAMERMFP